MFTLRIATAADAETMHAIIAASFAARPALDPPADALSETVESIAARIAAQHGVIASRDGDDVGCLFISYHDDARAMLHRVAVLPDARGERVAETMVRAAAVMASADGYQVLEIIARRELTNTQQWWSGYGFSVVSELSGHELLMRTTLPVRVEIPTADDMRAFGRTLAGLLTAGDVIVASGELGAGKTTLAQGLAQGLGVTEQVTSPTFVLSRVHPGERVNFVHVDAYRLWSAAELDDLDLDDTVASSVTMIEWGAGVAEQLSDSRLELVIERDSDPEQSARVVFVRGLGPRWADVDLHEWVAQK